MTKDELNKIRDEQADNYAQVDRWNDARSERMDQHFKVGWNACAKHLWPEIENSRNNLNIVNKAVGLLGDDFEALEAKLAIAIEALEFYASCKDNETWIMDGDKQDFYPLGAEARKALEKIKGDKHD